MISNSYESLGELRINKRGDREDIQDEGAGGEQGGYKDRAVDGGEQEDKESGKKANFYFPGLTPFFILSILRYHK